MNIYLVIEYFLESATGVISKALSLLKVTCMTITCLWYLNPMCEHKIQSIYTQFVNQS